MSDFNHVWEVTRLKIQVPSKKIYSTMSINSFYQIIPIRMDFLQRVREHKIDDLNQTVVRLIAHGGEPCRDVLRRANPGEELILASYCPFELAGPYREYGPVFVLANTDLINGPVTSFPASQENPYFSQQFVLRAYSQEERIVDACLSSPEQFESDLTCFFARDEITFVLARFAAYGCYGCRIERAVNFST